MTSKTFEQLKKEWLKDPKIKEDYRSMEVEFQVAASLIEARTKAHLTQSELAERMNSSQSHVARLESGNYLPSLTSILRYSKAVGRKIKIEIYPDTSVIA